MPPLRRYAMGPARLGRQLVSIMCRLLVAACKGLTSCASPSPRSLGLCKDLPALWVTADPHLILTAGRHSTGLPCNLLLACLL